MQMIHIFKKDIKSNNQEYLEEVVGVVGSPNGTFGESLLRQ